MRLQRPRPQTTTISRSPFLQRTPMRTRPRRQWNQPVKIPVSVQSSISIPSILQSRIVWSSQVTNPSAMKICITTTFDRNYKLSGYVLFKSIQRYTNCQNIDFKIITADPEVVKEFGIENCHFVDENIKNNYKNVKYSKELPPEKYAASWYRYEIFNFKQKNGQNYDRVICIDSDCLCLGDISYFFSEELNEFDILSVEDHIVSKCFTRYVPELEAQGLNFLNLKNRMKENKIDIQPALLIVNKNIVNETWYNKLIDYANNTDFTYSIDEGILNDFIYINNLKIKLLPLEYDYQDLYEIHCPELPVPSNPIIVHCQESKPFKKKKEGIDQRMHKWHDRWWEEYNYAKTIVAVIVYNRFENLKRWINCWKYCDKTNSELVVVHNLESDNLRYEQLCRENNIRYVPRENIGFDIGAFQDVCKERLKDFPNDWDNLIWFTDDTFPMQNDFILTYLDNLESNHLPCYEISDVVKRHIRTTGFLTTKEISKKIIFPNDPIKSKDDCYIFEHSSIDGTFRYDPKMGLNLYEQVKKMGLEPLMLVPNLIDSPVWDSGCRDYLQLMPEHERIFPVKL